MKKLLYIGNKLSVHGINLTGIEMLGPLLENEGFEMIYASAQKNKLLRFVDMVAKTIRYGRKADYVLIDTYSTSNFWYAYAVSQVCRLINIKYIPILHGGNLPQRLHKNPRLCKAIFANSYINVAPSRYLYEAFRNVGFSEVALVPNGIQTENYPFHPRYEIAPRLLWVRAFSEIYNPNMAIEVFANLRKKYANATLCMVGPDKDGSLQKAKELAAKLQLPVLFTGKLSKQEWIRRSENYDVFINTTHYDNTPMSVVEAMALGLPVVSTNVGGIPYLLTHNQTGLLVGDNDIENMAECIISLIENPDLVQKLVQNAHAVIRDSDIQTVARQWLEILK